jgi:hypothetical protein
MQRLFFLPVVQRQQMPVVPEKQELQEKEEIAAQPPLYHASTQNKKCSLFPMRCFYFGYFSNNSLYDIMHLGISYMAGCPIMSKGP